MSILMIGNFLSHSNGVRSVSEELCNRLEKRGWFIITTSNKLKSIIRLYDIASTIILQRNKYDIAHVEVYSGLAFRWAEMACGLLGWLAKPYALTLHGGGLQEFSQRWPGRVKNLLHGAKIVTTPSRFLQQELNYLHSDIICLPNAINVEDYYFRLRIKPTSSLIWLRAFHHIYNPSLALKAMALLIREFPDTRLVMVGPDKHDGSLGLVRKASKQAGLEDYIYFPGWIKKQDVPMWLDRGDIFINTTNYEAFGVSILEAMISGLCIVSTNVGGIPYLLEHEVDALLVPPNDAEAMADAIRRILTEPGLSGRLSQNARQKASQFDWSVILPQWEALFTSLMSA